MILVGVFFIVSFLKIFDFFIVYKGFVIIDINNVIIVMGFGLEDYYGDGDLLLFLFGFFLVVFVVGLLVFVVVFVGCCGGCCRNFVIIKLV